MESIKLQLKEKDIEKKVESLAKEWKSEATVPGFRKGKAPVQLIKTRLREELRAESLQKLIEEGVLEIVDKYEPFIYSPPQLKDTSESEDNIEFEVLLDVPPKIDIDLSKIKLKQKNNIDESDISTELERLRKINSELKSVNRAIKKGDTVFLDISSGKQSLPNYSISVGNDNFTKEIIGLKRDEEKEIETKFPANFPIENLANKKGTITVKIIAVKKEILPELNDDFAKDLGFDNMKELKTDLKKGLEEEQKENQKDSIRDQVLTQVLNQLDDLEINPTLLEMLKREGTPEEEAIKQAKGLTLLDAIALKEKLTIEEKELDEWMDRIAESEDNKLDEMGEEAIRFIKHTILRDKALDYLVEKVSEEVKNG
ncbi:trigger factor [candidate division WOR-3 bacterium]|nr:trigger factor [candidate division WOR-3 bacterium]